MIRGIISLGGRAHYLGMSTTPLYNFVLNDLKFAGGIMVTASHNPDGWGGFKVFDSEGAIADKKLAKYAQLVTNENVLPDSPLHKAVQKSNVIKDLSQYGGEVKLLNRERLLDRYATAAVKVSNIKLKDIVGIKIKIEGSTPLLREVHHLRKILPLKIVTEGFDVVFKLDEDADRIAVYDRSENLIRSDHLFGLFVQKKKRFWKKPIVVHDPRFSRGVLEMFKKWGIKFYRSKAGRSFIREAMVKHRADLGAELTGHFFYKTMHSHEASLLTMLDTLLLLQNNKKDLQTMTKQFLSWRNSGEINIPLASNPKTPVHIIESLKQKFHDGHQDQLDGLCVSYKDWWFLVRASNTEPVIRLIVEARNESMMKETTAELEAIIKA